MPIAAALPYIATAVSAAGTLSSMSASRKAQAAQKDALLAQKDIVANLKYEPINLENLKEETRKQAINNATQSLALERDLHPDVAATRQQVAQRVRSDLALGGNLSPDIANQVARASRTMGAMSGAPAGPLTAAQIGTTAEALRFQRLGQANQLLRDNPLKPVGLDPGSLASAMVAQNAAMNQFNVMKAGANANLAQSTGQVGASAAAAQGAERSAMLNAIPGLISGLGNLPIFGGDKLNLGLSQPPPNFLANAKVFEAPQSLTNYTIPTFGSSGSMLPRL